MDVTIVTASHVCPTSSIARSEHTYDFKKVQVKLPVGLNCLEENARDRFVHDKEFQELVKISCMKQDLKEKTTLDDDDYYY